MASVNSDNEPLCDVDILIDKRVLLGEDLILDNVMTSITPFLSYHQLEDINAEHSQADKKSKLFDILHRLSPGRPDMFNAFIKSLAGTQPKVFEGVVGRVPTESEADFCVKNAAEDLKKNITETGHRTDSKLDEQIDLDSGHVELSIVGGGASVVDRPSPGSQLPENYNEHLTRLEKTGRNITTLDVLKRRHRSKPPQKVLMFGLAGIGKTTTFQWLARQWARGNWASRFTILFLLQLRVLSSQHSRDNASISTIELLTQYGLFPMFDLVNPNVLTSWLTNCSARLLLMIDGLDEIPGFADRLINTRRITNILQKAHPIDLCINLLRGDLLPGSTVICASRPFLGLNELHVDTKSEILGLTRQKITEFIERQHPNKAKHILSVLVRNPFLMSVCTITYYCMMISTLLSEGVTLLGEDIQTYTRLMAFIIVQYSSRKIPTSPFVMEVASYFSKLADLAYRGIFQSEENEGLAKLVFDENDFVNSRIDDRDLESIKKVGLLKLTGRKTGRTESYAAEFFHLSGQEMLAVSKYLSDPSSDDVLSRLFSGGQFDMALLYIFGLHFDRKNKWINTIHRGINSSGYSPKELMDSKLSSFLLDLENRRVNGMVDSKDILKICQLIYEGQWVEKANRMSLHVVQHGKLCIMLTPMTAIDLMAVDFVCKWSSGLHGITLNRVNADDTFVEVMVFSLFQHSLCSLQELDLSDNHIGDLGAAAIAGAFSETEGEISKEDVSDRDSSTTEKEKDETQTAKACLQKLDLSRNEIGDDGAKALARMLNYQNLLDLNISGNEIGDKGIEELAGSLHNNTTLKRLSIGKKTFGERGLQAMSKMLQQNECLETLTLLDSNMQDDRTKILTQGLVNNSTISDLNLFNNCIGLEGTKALCELLSTNTCIQRLSLDGNMIGDAGTHLLAEGLVKNYTLTSLDVSGNNISEQGAKSIAGMLKTNACLKALDIGFNQIGDGGAKAIADAIWKKEPPKDDIHTNLSMMPNNPTESERRPVPVMHHNNTSLEKLSLDKTGIADEGAKAIAEALAWNTTIKELDIGFNHIGDPGATAMANMLNSNTCLERLSANKTSIGDAGAIAMAEMIHPKSKLQQLDLSGNNIGDEGAKALLELLSRNHGIHTFHLFGIRISPELQQVIDKI